MVTVSVEHEFQFGADVIWAIIADFGNVSWVPGIEKVELEGEGVGMIRHLTVPTLPQLHERLDAIDPEQMILDYSIPEVPYLQVVDYKARAHVTPIDAERCQVVWSCKTGVDEGVADAQAEKNLTAFYNSIMTWIENFILAEK